ncbi:hypothetical protein EYF80_031774 [Liparis tanakae]|uniref:Uncharacterized protein n=1 Tax=Liparis tanakae TaxID=230148 RepID=A0A4Z2GWX1_9TELE|nr:hypothetical protein EYF80_031774 [Liparis tanakae]
MATRCFFRSSTTSAPRDKGLSEGVRPRQVRGEADEELERKRRPEEETRRRDYKKRLEEETRRD